jgi:hypothetical protein
MWKNYAVAEGSAFSVNRLLSYAPHRIVKLKSKKVDGVGTVKTFCSVFSGENIQAISLRIWAVTGSNGGRNKT